MSFSITSKLFYNVRRAYFLILVFISSYKINSQSDTIKVYGNVFILTKQAKKSEYLKKDTIVKIYHLKGETKKHIVSFHLYKYAEDCSNVFKDFGTVEIKNNNLVLKTRHWQKGQDPIPKFSKKIYTIQPSGKLILIFDKVYLFDKWVQL